MKWTVDLFKHTLEVACVYLLWKHWTTKVVQIQREMSILVQITDKYCKNTVQENMIKVWGDVIH